MGEEKEVRKEDQDRINRFSRLHSREKLIEEDLKTKQASFDCIQEAQGAPNTFHRKTRKIWKRSHPSWSSQTRTRKSRKCA